MTNRDEFLHVMGMREAAEIARTFRPNSACTCGNYSTPSHQPGCLVGECLEIAEEIEARADELERRGRCTMVPPTPLPEANSNNKGD